MLSKKDIFILIMILIFKYNQIQSHYENTWLVFLLSIMTAPIPLLTMENWYALFRKKDGQEKNMIPVFPFTLFGFV